MCVESELTSGAALRTVGQVVEQMQEEMQKLPESCTFSLLLGWFSTSHLLDQTSVVSAPLVHPISLLS